jgi:hypothetical protein
VDPVLLRELFAPLDAAAASTSAARRRGGADAVSDRDVLPLGQGAPDNGRALFRHSITLRPFGPSSRPFSHFIPTEPGLAARVMPGEAVDPRMCGCESPASPSAPVPVVEYGRTVGFTSPLPVSLDDPPAGPEPV